MMNKVSIPHRYGTTMEKMMEMMKMATESSVNSS